MDTARMKAVRSGSLGLISMEERAELVGGRLKIRSAPGEGSVVQVVFVLDQPDNPVTHDRGAAKQDSSPATHDEAPVNP